MTDVSSAAGDAVTPVLIPKKVLPDSLVLPPSADLPSISQTPAEEPLKPDTTDKTSSEPEAATTGEEGGEQEPRKPSKLETIQRLRQERRELRAERDRLRAENERLNRPLVKDRDALDYDERERLRTREALRDERRDSIQERAQEIQQADKQIAEREMEAVHTAVFDALDGAKDRFPDLTEKFATSINLTQDTVDFLSQSEKVAEIANHLVLHPDIADKLYSLTNPKTATATSLREADRILVRLEAQIEKPAPRKATKAPNPGTTLNGGTPPGAERPLTELSGDMDKFAPAFIKKLRERQRR